MGIFSKLFGGGSPDPKLLDFLARGAAIIDVRSPGEFAAGHASGAQNFPLRFIAQSVPKLKKLGKPLIVCCRSGARSGQAIPVLAKAGLECANGGSWQNVQKGLSSDA